MQKYRLYPLVATDINTYFHLINFDSCLNHIVITQVAGRPDLPCAAWYIARCRNCILTKFIGMLLQLNSRLTKVRVVDTTIIS